MQTLDLAIHTLFAEFQEAVFQRASIERSLNQETFTKKQIKGNKYWYRQHYVKGKPVQSYHGPSTPELERSIAQGRLEVRARQLQLRQMLREERRRAAMLRRGGLPGLDSLTSMVLERLSETLLIDQLGVLVGSYAFAAYSGILGRLFEKQTLKTVDIDIAREERSLTVAAEPIDIRDLLTFGDLRFHDVPGLSPKDLPTSFVGPHGLRIDLVSPLRGKATGIIRAPGLLHAGTQPLHFLDFLIEDPVRAVLIGPKGGIPVTVPQPGRFAVHKLILSTERPVTESAKRAKDIAQAAQLILACSEEQPTEIAWAYREAVQRGKGWKQRLQKASERLPVEVLSTLQKTCKNHKIS